MLNPAQIHLALNHFPVVGTMVGVLILGVGCTRKMLPIKRTGLFVLVFSALSVLPTYLSGEPAEEIVEHKPGVSEALIHEHEEAAELALVFAALTGGLSLFSLIMAGMKKESLEKKGSMATLVLALVTTGTLANAAHQGGLIRHDELRSGAEAPVSGEEHEHEEKDED